MFDLKIPDAVHRQALDLARKCKWTIDDNPSIQEYVEFLCGLVKEQPGAEKHPEFVALARHVCVVVYGTARPEIRKRIAANALSIIRHQSLRVVDIEDMADFSSGSLARIKNGGGPDMSPLQVIYLAAELKVPISLLVGNFDNNPEGLRLSLEECEALPAEPEVSIRSEVPVTTEDVAEPQDPLQELAIEATPAVSDAVSATSLEGPTVVPDTSVRDGKEIATHVRIAAKKAGKTLTSLLDHIGVKNRRYLEQVELGNEPAFTTDQLEAMAQFLGVTRVSLETGAGLSPSQKRKSATSASGALVPVGSKKLVLPPVSVESMNDFFRSRCLRKGVNPAEGHDLSELLDAAGSKEAVDWFRLWREVTAEGAAYTERLSRVVEMSQSWGVVMKTTFLENLHQALFPEVER